MSPTWNVVDATVDNHCSRLDPLSFHHLCFPDPNNQDVCLAHLVTTKRIIMFDRDMRLVFHLLSGS